MSQQSALEAMDLETAYVAWPMDNRHVIITVDEMAIMMKILHNKVVLQQQYSNNDERWKFVSQDSLGTLRLAPEAITKAAVQRIALVEALKEEE